MRNVNKLSTSCTAIQSGISLRRRPNFFKNERSDVLALACGSGLPCRLGWESQAAFGRWCGKELKNQPI